MPWTIFLVLVVLWMLGVVSSYTLGGFIHVLLLLAIAGGKASLVVLYFMHVRWSSRLTWLVLGSGIYFLLILFTFTMMDYMSRGWMPGTLR